MDFETELHEKFHNLPGSTVAEKKKNLNSFISELNNKIPQKTTINTFVTNLKPKNKLETVFRVDLLLHYQIYDVVLELLKSGNELYISMILKDWNFFKETFRNVNGNTFVNDVLTRTSFAARMKIINRVSKNLCDEKKADEYFEAVEKKYGISSAETMLTSCSLDLIKAKVKKYNLKLRQRQLMAMLKRDSEFLRFYFRHLDRIDSDFHDLEKRNIVKATFKYNEELFWKLCEKYSVKVNFGKHLSKKALRDKEYFFKDAKSCCVEFQRRQVYKRLRQNPEAFKQFILQRTSDEITDFCENFTASYTEIGKFIYRHISKGKRYRFLNCFFKEKFACNIHDKPEIVTENILRLMPENFRENVLETKIKETERLAYLYRPEISVPFIMDKIKHCSDRKKRISYVSMLYRSCEFSENDGYLLEVLKYVEKRHRNDTSALEKLMDGLKSWNNIENLSVEHWTYIVRIQKLLKLKNIVVAEKLFLEKHIVHLLNNNLDATEQIQNYFDFLRRNTYTNHFFENAPKYRRLFILEMEKCVDKIEDKEESDSLSVRYLHWVYYYNLSTPSKDDIPILKYLPLIHKQLKEDRLSDVKDIVEFYVRLHYEEFNPIIWEYKRDFFEEMRIGRKEKTLFHWYSLKHEDELLNNIELIFEIDSVRKNLNFIRYLSLYSFRNIPEKLSQLSVKTMQGIEGCINDKIVAVSVLSLLDEEEFLGILELFNPNDDGKFSVDEPSSKVKLQEAFLKNLPRLNPSANLLQILSKFCVGDYLNYALKPLYSITSRVIQNESVLFLKKLHRSAVSVRKHTIHLGKFIFPLDDYINFIIKESLAEKNASLKNILFQKGLEFARIMPNTARIWELIDATMNRVDKDDVEAHDLLLNIEQIPEEYRAAYIPKAYVIFAANPILDINRKRFDFIKNVPAGVIDKLDRNLLETFLTEVIFHEYWRYRDCWLKFIFHSTGEKQNFLYDLALGKLEEYNSSRPNDDIDDKQSSFVDNLCEAILEFRPSHAMVQKFASMWFAKFAPEIDVDRHFYLTFVSTYAACQYDTKEFASATKVLLKTYSDCLELFAESLKHFVGGSNTLDACEFMESFLADQDSVVACLLSIRIMSVVTPETKDEALRYTSIIEKLKRRPELSVRIYYRKYLYDFEEELKEKL